MVPVIYLSTSTILQCLPFHYITREHCLSSSAYNGILFPFFSPSFWSHFCSCSFQLSEYLCILVCSLTNDQHLKADVSSRTQRITLIFLPGHAGKWVDSLAAASIMDGKSMDRIDILTALRDSTSLEDHHTRKAQSLSRMREICIKIGVVHMGDNTSETTINIEQAP